MTLTTTSFFGPAANVQLQFEFLRQLSANPANTVVGLVRDPKSVEPKVESELGRSNIHIVKGDLDDYESLKVGLILLSVDDYD